MQIFIIQLKIIISVVNELKVVEFSQHVELVAAYFDERVRSPQNFLIFVSLYQKFDWFLVTKLLKQLKNHQILHQIMQVLKNLGDFDFNVFLVIINLEVSDEKLLDLWIRLE